MPKTISVTQKGNFKKTNRFLHNIIEHHYMNRMRYYGELGVEALKKATPQDSGETAKSWSYEIVEEQGTTSIYWKNDNYNNGVNIAIILQYGHATRNGAWVEGIDYINPALKPIFDRMAEDAWKEVVSG